MIREGGRVETKRLSSDFEWSWARFSNAEDGSTLQELVLLGGQNFRIDGDQIINLSERRPWMHARYSGSQFSVESPESDDLRATVSDSDSDCGKLESRNL